MTELAMETVAPPDRIERQNRPFDLIQQALTSNVAPEVIRELVALQQSMERFNWEREERQAKIDFDNALNACQKQIGRIAPNQKRENEIKWADYVQIDRTVRPIYIDAGFSIGFSEVDSGDKNILKMRATLSRGGISREYFGEISRLPGNSKMNALDASASAASRVKRYLLLSIFNIAIGIDKDEKIGIPQTGQEMAIEEFDDWKLKIESASDPQKLINIHAAAHKRAVEIGDKGAVRQFMDAKNRRKEDLR
jgi:ERF superfamily protein